MEITEISSLALAFYGDAVYELYVRRQLVKSGQGKPDRLHKSAVEKVCASYQAAAVHRIEGLLSEKEADVLRRGRNASGVKAPKHANVIDYRYATGLEALIGWLALTEQNERIDFLMQVILTPEENYPKGTEDCEK